MVTRFRSPPLTLQSSASPTTVSAHSSIPRIWMNSSVRRAAMSLISSTMLNGGLERFYKKYDHLSHKVNIQLPSPEVRFENLSFTAQVPASVEDHGTVGSHLRGIFTPWQRPAMVTKHALHSMSGIIKPGTLTLILTNPGAGKSTFLKALAGELQNSSKTKLGGEILYSGLRGDEIDLIKLAGMVDQTDNHIPTLTVRETFKFADMCVNGLPKDQSSRLSALSIL